MSQALRNLAIEAFHARAQNAFETGSKLRSRVMTVTGVEAESYRFPVVGRGNAIRRASGADVTPANLGNWKPTAALSPRESFDFLDKQDLALTNVDAMRAYGEAHGKAVSREFDEDIIEVLKAWDATAYTRPGLNAVKFVTAATAGKIAAADIAKMSASLRGEDFDVNEEDVTFVYDAEQFGELATETLLSSLDYVDGKVTNTGRFGMIYGATPIGIGQLGREDGHGKLPEKRAYMFTRNAIGLAIGTTENMSVVEFLEKNRSWLVGAECNAGATRIQNPGVVELRIP